MARAKKLKVSEEAAELISWIQDGEYDIEYDLTMLAEAIAERFANLRELTDNDEAHEGPQTEELLVHYRRWWITKRADLKKSGVLEKDLPQQLGSSGLAHYAYIYPELEPPTPKKWSDDDEVICFPKLKMDCEYDLGSGVEVVSCFPVWDADLDKLFYAPQDWLDLIVFEEVEDEPVKDPEAAKAKAKADEEWDAEWADFPEIDEDYPEEEDDE